uniref:Secreted protein n=1 Tax=Calidris pygmaea TaxID=425635 RepID=A0A8C3J0V2_9CHAR
MQNPAYRAGPLRHGSLSVFLLLSPHLSHYTSPGCPSQPLPGAKGGYSCPWDVGGTEEPRGRGGRRQHPRVPR